MTTKEVGVSRITMVLNAKDEVFRVRYYLDDGTTVDTIPLQAALLREKQT